MRMCVCGDHILHSLLDVGYIFVCYLLLLAYSNDYIYRWAFTFQGSYCMIPQQRTIVLPVLLLPPLEVPPPNSSISQTISTKTDLIEN